MERSSKRGKIPQQDWPAIIKRYEAGETLAGIARTYDCSPPAISYIVSRSRARDAMGEGAIEPVEPRLAKSNNTTGRLPVNASTRRGSGWRRFCGNEPTRERCIGSCRYPKRRGFNRALSLL